MIQYFDNFHLLIYAGIFIPTILAGFYLGYNAGFDDATSGEKK